MTLRECFVFMATCPEFIEGLRQDIEARKFKRGNKLLQWTREERDKSDEHLEIIELIGQGLTTKEIAFKIKRSLENTRKKINKIRAERTLRDKISDFKKQGLTFKEILLITGLSRSTVLDIYYAEAEGY